MGLFKNAAAWLGLVDQAWVKVKGPGVDVVISGDKDRVNGLLVAVQREMIRILEASKPPPAAPMKSEPSAVVPKEFDEKDSPYVVSGRVLRPRPRPGSGVKRSPRAAGFLVDPKDLRTLRGPRPPVMDDAETEHGQATLQETTEH